MLGKYLCIWCISLLLQTKDERIVALETENAMLYLKLAQMRSNLQSSREEVSGLQSQYEGETKFRQNVMESALKFKQELEVCTVIISSINIVINHHHNQTYLCIWLNLYLLLLYTYLLPVIMLSMTTCFCEIWLCNKYSNFTDVS